LSKNRVIIELNSSIMGYPYVVSTDIQKEFLQRGIIVEAPFNAKCISSLVDAAGKEDYRFRILMNFAANQYADDFGIKTISWMQDNPFQLFNGRAVCNFPHQFYFCADEDYANEVGYWLDAVNEGVHLPHWATEIIPNILSENYIEKTFDDRPVEILFVGSVGIEKAKKTLAQINSLKNPYSKIAIGVVEILLSRDDRSVTEIGMAVDASLGLEIHKNERENFRRVLSLADTFVRFENRNRLFKALHGLPISAVSPNAADIAGLAGDKVRKFPSDDRGADFVRGLFGMCNAKLMINNLPNYRRGVTERLFNAQYRGCAVLSERNIFLEKEFSDDEDIFLYDPSDLKGLRERILYILNDKKKLKEVALAGYRNTKNNHLFKHRLDKILELH